MNRWLLHRAAKPILLVLALLPLAGLLHGAFTDRLGPNPAEALIRQSGDWALRLLLVTLAITPLRQWTGWHALLRHRRMLGLVTAFYAAMHFLAYAWLDQGFELVALLRDIAKRPFILVGSLALLLMLPLAITSTNAAIRRLGGRRWRALHRLVYAVLGLVLLHYFWMKAGKRDFAEWSVHAAIAAVLMGWRLYDAWRPVSAAGPAGSPPRASMPVEPRR